MKIAVLGSGYVGLVTGACLSQWFEVTCIDKVSSKIAKLKLGKVEIHEAGLQKTVKRNLRRKSLAFTTKMSVLQDHDTIIIAVGTPQAPNGEAEISYIEEAVAAIAKHSKTDKVIIIKSTVPVGTADKVKVMLRKAKPKLNFEVISNPEFLREGRAMHDFMEPDRIVIGCDSEKAREVAAKVYATTIKKNVTMLVTSNRSAELIKYAANSYLAMKIAFVNEIAGLCEAVGANIEDVTKGMGLDKRIGPHYLKPGPGYGGSCLPKDTSALLKCMQQNQQDSAKIIEAIIQSNQLRKEEMSKKIIKIVGKPKSDESVAILGLTFKANTNDLRDSSSIDIVNALVKYGYSVKAYDPEISPELESGLPRNVQYCSGIEECIEGSSAVVILTEWKEFLSVPLEIFKYMMRLPVVIDLRNIFEPQIMKEAGISYHSIGRS